MVQQELEWRIAHSKASLGNMYCDLTVARGNVDHSKPFQCTVVDSNQLNIEMHPRTLSLSTIISSDIKTIQSGLSCSPLLAIDLQLGTRPHHIGCDNSQILSTIRECRPIEY